MASKNPFQFYKDTPSSALFNSADRFDISSTFQQGQNGETSIKATGVPSMRLFIFFAFFLCILFVLWFRLFDLQIFRGLYFRNSAEINRIRTVTVKATRGLIYDSSGQILLRNIPDFSLVIIPADLPQNEKDRMRIFQEASALSGISLEDMKSRIDYPKLRYSYQPVVVQEHVEYEKALLLSTKTPQWPGITLDVIASRDYLAGQFFSPILGYTGLISEAEFKDLKEKGYVFSDYVGKSGVESYYEESLRGVYGKKQIEVDSLRKERRIISEQEAVAGKGLKLSVNKEMQDKLGELLQKMVTDKKSPGGAAVALNPKNGEVLALVSVPTYDNNLFTRGLSPDEYKKLIEDENRPLFHRVLTGQYPSGSTIKMIIAAAALQEHVISPTKKIMSTGGIRVGQWFFPDWKSGGHGATDMRKALAESVNTYFYTIGGGFDDVAGLGIERMGRYASQFGLGAKLNIDLPGESSGFFPTKEWKVKAKGESWYIGDTYHASIGQGDVLVTPLQVADFTAAIANGGTLYRPHVASAILSPSGDVEQRISPEVLQKNFVSAGNIQVVREGLRETVVSGSARSLSVLPIEVAGKTGTAQGSKDNLHAWFTSFAPYHDPDIVLTILVENGGEGSSTAVPIARDFYTWYAEHTGIPR